MTRPVWKNLPKPQMIETIVYDDIVDARMDAVAARFVANGVTYDVGDQETDTVKIVVEDDGFKEVNLRARINDAAAANLVAFSEGADLDNVVGFYGVERLPDEEDDPLKERTVLENQGQSPAGPEERYLAIARGVSANIKDARIYQVDGGPVLRVAILTFDNGGVPGAPLLAAVTAAIDADDKVTMNDVVEVVAAVQTTQAISAGIWLLPEAPQSAFDELEEKLRAAWAAESGIGFDLATSWIDAKLMQPGVALVADRLPAATVVADDNHAIAIGAVALAYLGRRR